MVVKFELHWQDTVDQQINMTHVVKVEEEVIENRTTRDMVVVVVVTVIIEEMVVEMVEEIEEDPHQEGEDPDLVQDQDQIGVQEVDPDHLVFTNAHPHQEDPDHQKGLHEDHNRQEDVQSHRQDRNHQENILSHQEDQGHLEHV